MPPESVLDRLETSGRIGELMATPCVGSVSIREPACKGPNRSGPRTRMEPSRVAVYRRSAGGRVQLNAGQPTVRSTTSSCGILGAARCRTVPPTTARQSCNVSASLSYTGRSKIAELSVNRVA